MRKPLPLIVAWGACLSLLLAPALTQVAAIPDQYNFSQRMSTFTEVIDGALQSAQTAVVSIARSVLSVSMAVMAAVYAPMVVLGVLLYTTRVNRYMGKDLIFGALLLAFFSEYIIPSLMG